MFSAQFYTAKIDYKVKNIYYMSRASLSMPHGTKSQNMAVIFGIVGLYLMLAALDPCTNAVCFATAENSMEIGDGDVSDNIQFVSDYDSNDEYDSYGSNDEYDSGLISHSPAGAGRGDC